MARAGLLRHLSHGELPKTLDLELGWHRPGVSFPKGTCSCTKGLGPGCPRCHHPWDPGGHRTLPPATTSCPSGHCHVLGFLSLLLERLNLAIPTLLSTRPFQAVLMNIMNVFFSFSFFNLKCLSTLSLSTTHVPPYSRLPPPPPPRSPRPRCAFSEGWQCPLPPSDPRLLLCPLP